MFINYEKSDVISGVNQQHNIMVIVGNGFDIAVLNKYRKDNLVSSYSKFYDYLCYKGVSTTNILFQKMTYDKVNGKENWSDFEETIGELIQENASILELNEALKEVQNYFLLFLNELVEPEILVKESEDAEFYKWGINSLSNFLSDLNTVDYLNMTFPKTTDHYHMFNFLFVNFNYTSLLDNYLYLDKGQFEPHPYKSVDTNFRFHPNPQRYGEDPRHSETVWSTFVMTNIIHPHGYQSIPRSLLFGIENRMYLVNKEFNKFNKSYWAQNDQRYSKYFEDTQLFIIYGSSIGKTDSWWWRRILDSLINRDCELIIYYYALRDTNKDAIKERFISACGDSILAIEEFQNVKEKIYVILFSDVNQNMLFGLK